MKRWPFKKKEREESKIDLILRNKILEERMRENSHTREMERPPSSYNGQCGSEALEKDPSEGGQPQESTDSNLDSNSDSRAARLDW